MQHGDSRTIKFLFASVNAKKEDLREIIGILLSLLVIAAFLSIAFTMSDFMAKDAGDTVKAIVQ
ncbi:MAG: hypothetical protein EG824_12885 [Deltaproteobacteria bacterium]|nr:hypothetical protein [Deltaproteobacteria bacterium]